MFLILRMTRVAQLLSSVTEATLFNHELGPIDLIILCPGPRTGSRQTEAEAATTQEGPLDLTGAGKPKAEVDLGDSLFSSLNIKCNYIFASSAQITSGCMYVQMAPCRSAHCKVLSLCFDYLFLKV